VNRILRNILILISPFIIMIIVNETYRLQKDDNIGFIDTFEVISPIKKHHKTCSWNCYYNTAYCKVHHVKYLKPFYKYIDPLYYAEIKFLHNFNNYKLANIIFMVILWPLIMYLLLINSLNLHKRIRKTKQ